MGALSTRGGSGGWEGGKRLGRIDLGVEEYDYDRTVDESTTLMMISHCFPKHSTCILTISSLDGGKT